MILKGKDSKGGLAMKRKKSPLEIIPGVGPSLSKDLEELGCREITDLAGVDPEELYSRLQQIRGTKVDRCVLYVFREAVYFASNSIHEPEKLKWWNWKDHNTEN